MEFGHYFTGSYMDSESWTAFWPYPATVSGNFLANNPTAGTFPTSQVIQRTISLGDSEDFSLFLTTDSGVVSAPPEFQFRTQVLVSCANVSGWDFGILASNSFFVSCPNGEIYNFDTIKLGVKNCFCLVKAGQSFTVYKYDIYSQQIESEQTIFFTNNANLNSGGSLYIGYNANSDVGRYSYSWYGQIDQLALINEAVERSIANNLFSGFEPATFNVSTTYSNYLADSVWRPSTINSEYLSLLSPMITGVRNHAISLGNGNYISYFSGDVSSTFSGSGYFVSGLDLCYGAGSSNLFEYNSNSGVVAGMSTSGWYITDTIRTNTYLAGASGLQSTESLITHNFSIYYDSGNVAKVSYDELLYIDYATHSTGITIDSNYYTGFYMNGVSQNNYYNNSILLGNITGGVPTGINMLGEYDQVSGLFSVVEQSGYYFYNGMRVPSTGMSKYGEYINITSVAEVDSDTLIYDMYSGLNLLYFGLQGFATGDYYPRTATPYTGDNSFSIMYRNLPSYYHETSRLNMFHGQPVLYQNNSNQFNNLEDYWS